MEEEIKIKYKQYVIVPKKPRMSKGKIASQVAHATFMALKKQNNNKKMPEHPLIQKWIGNGMCVIVLECNGPIQLFGIDKYLEQWNIPHHIYIDEGLTEVKMGTPTALATGVMTEDQFWMFETMEMLK